MTGIVYTPEFVERGYNLRAAVPEHPQWFEHYAATSAEARARFAPRLDLRYGPGPKETLDLFVPARPARGTLVFLHGGYWRALDKSDFSYVAPPFLAHDLAVAVVNYDLCPDVTVATIVDECRRALAWLVREGAALGAPADRIVIAGHSAGGHLTAMMFVDRLGGGRAAPHRQSPAASRSRASTTSHRSCCSRSTPTSGSTTLKPHDCLRFACGRARRRRS